MKIEIGKQYRTRDGKEVRIYAVDAGSDKPVHGAIFQYDTWSIMNWSLSGNAGAFVRDLDLIEVKPRHVRWVNVYPLPGGVAHGDRGQADFNATSGRIACVRIAVEEGEGLE